MKNERMTHSAAAAWLDAHPQLAAYPQTALQILYIQDLVAERYGISTAALTGRSRVALVVQPRQAAQYLIRRCLSLSYEIIGAAFDCDHGTVMHNVRAVQDRMSVCPLQKAAIEDLETIIREHCAIRAPARAYAAKLFVLPKAAA